MGLASITDVMSHKPYTLRLTYHGIFWDGNLSLQLCDASSRHAPYPKTRSLRLGQELEKQEHDKELLGDNARVLTSDSV